MILTRTRSVFLISLSITVMFITILSQSKGTALNLNQLLWDTNNHNDKILNPEVNEKFFFWAQLKQRYPVQSTVSLPSPAPKNIPPIQYHFPEETRSSQTIRQARLDAVRGNFSHAWQGYKDYAWMRDEVKPLSGQAHDLFGGWAATLVDTSGV